MSQVKLSSTFQFSFPEDICLNDRIRQFDITLETSSGQLNRQTGDIISYKDITNLIRHWRDQHFHRVRSIYNIGNLEYLPRTMEIVAERMWEWIEEILPFNVRLKKLRLYSTSAFFVEYTREEQVLQPVPQPKPKLRKRRKKKGGRKKGKSKNRNA